MFRKIKIILMCSCFCGFFSACATTDRPLVNSNRVSIRTAVLTPEIQTTPIENAFFDLAKVAMAIYTIGKIKHGPELVQIYSNHKLRELEIKRRVGNTISVTNHERE